MRKLMGIFLLASLCISSTALSYNDLDGEPKIETTIQNENYVFDAITFEVNAVEFVFSALEETKIVALKAEPKVFASNNAIADDVGVFRIRRIQENLILKATTHVIVWTDLPIEPVRC